MNELYALGSLSVRRDGEEADAVLAQPKRAALLAYLGLVQPQGFHRRDALLAMFWPEQDQSHARAALRQAVYFLRHQLGEDAVVRRGDDELALAPGAWWTDVAAFSAAVARDDLEEALRLYCGDLLASLHVPDAPEFERWLEREQERVKGAARTAACRLLERSIERRDAASALQWAHRAFGLAPEDEAPLRALMRFLAESGDGAAAAREYERFEARLREEFDLEPLPETRQLFERIRPQLPASPSGGRHERRVPRQVEPRRPAAIRNPGRSQRPKRIAWPRAALVAGAVFSGVIAMKVHPWHDPAVDPAAVLVLPFEVGSSDPADAWLGEGMVDMLTPMLGAGMSVVDPGLTMTEWRRILAGEDPRASTAAALALAARMGAGNAVVGSVVGGGERLQVSAALLSAESGAAPRVMVAGPADSVLVLVADLAGRLLGASAGEQPDRLAALSRSPRSVWLYANGMRAGRHAATDSARDYFTRALELDSTFALAAYALQHSLSWGFTRYSADEIARAERLAWEGREKLPPRDRAVLETRLGRSYPQWVPPAERLAFADSLTGVLRDVPELWYELGKLRFHGGAPLALPGYRELALRAFRRAIELDSAYLSPRNLLQNLVIELGDTVRLKALRAEYRRYVPTAKLQKLEWQIEAALAHLRGAPPVHARQLEGWDEFSLRRLVIESLSHGFGLVEAESAIAILLRRAASGPERSRTLLLARELALNRGRSRAAAAMNEELAGLGPAAGPRHERLRDPVYHALYWEGDSAAGDRAAAALADLLASPPPDPGEQEEQQRDRCALEEWRLAHGDSSTVPGTIEALRQGASEATRRERLRAISCAAMLEARLAVGRRHPRARQLVHRFDSLQVAALPDLRHEDVAYSSGLLVSAALHERLGDLAGALWSLRRHGEPGDRKILLSTFLREEHRLLAAHSGDRAGAARALCHLRALRGAAALPPLSARRVRAAPRGAPQRAGSKRGGACIAAAVRPAPTP